MTIETGNATHNARHVKHTDAHKGARGQQPAGDTPPGTDFMAILAGLGGDDSVLLDPTSVELNASPDPSVIAPGLDLHAPVAAPDPGVVLPSTKPLFGPETEVQGDAALALGVGVVDDRSPSKPPVDGALLAGSRAEKLPAAAEGADAATPAGEGVNALAGILAKAEVAVAPRVPGPAGGPPKESGVVAPAATDRIAAKDLTAAAATDTKDLLAGRDAKPVKPPAEDTGLLYDRETQGVGTNTRSGAMEQKLQGPIVGGAQAQVATAPAVVAAAPEFSGVLRESTRARFAEKRSSTDTLSSGVTPPPTPLGVDPTSVSAPTEMVIAEKVAYWLSNDVQKAELKLDGLGEQPVEVSIRLQGNEAHVAFRTDELQARNALEQAGSALKDLLQREGLMLAGVSVGTTGTGDGQRESDRNGRFTARKGTVDMVVAPDASTSRPRGLTMGRSLDLFV